MEEKKKLRIRKFENWKNKIRKSSRPFYIPTLKLIVHQRAVRLI